MLALPQRHNQFLQELGQELAKRVEETSEQELAKWVEEASE